MKCIFRSTSAHVVLTALMAAHSAGAAQPAEAARTFLEKLYGNYADEDHDWSPLEDNATRLFDRGLLKLIREDQNRVGNEAGLLDFDPVCNCQDFSGLKLISVKSKMLEPGRVTATATFINTAKVEKVGFLLSEVDGEWRITDIWGRRMPSLRQLLRTGVAVSKNSVGEKKEADSSRSQH